MAVRGVYSPAEEKMLSQTNRNADRLVGWSKMREKVATKETMKNYALAVDFWNPLWRDESYAENTRWGGIIALPLYQERFGAEHFNLETRKESGFPQDIYVDDINMGEDWEFHKPIYPGDSFKVWHRRPNVEDVTDEKEKGPRKFRLLVHDLDHINQRNELVSSFKMYMHCTFLAAPPRQTAFAKYVYSKEELEYIDSIVDQEEIRGSDIRYWEDVNVGDETKPVILEQTTILDQAAFSVATMGFFPPQRTERKTRPWELMQDPETGIYHSRIEMHLSEEVARLRGFKYPINFRSMTRHLLARLLTNWMGDDGFIRKFSWRQFCFSNVGDTIIGTGKVTDKRMENGEHLVEISSNLTNLRGNITDASVAIVSLLSRENLLNNESADK